MKSRKLMVIASIAGILTLAACAAPPTAKETEASVKAATATAINGVDANSIAVSDIVRSAARTTWKASTSSGQFDCDADEQLRLPQCAPRGA